MGRRDGFQVKVRHCCRWTMWTASSKLQDHAQKRATILTTLHARRIYPARSIASGGKMPLADWAVPTSIMLPATLSRGGALVRHRQNALVLACDQDVMTKRPPPEAGPAEIIIMESARFKWLLRGFSCPGHLDGADRYAVGQLRDLPLFWCAKARLRLSHGETDHSEGWTWKRARRVI